MDCNSKTDKCGDCSRSHWLHHQPGGRSLPCDSNGFRTWGDIVRCKHVGVLAASDNFEAASDDFEAHIIFDSEHAESVSVMAKLAGWKFSKIDGDPYLGNGVRCYLTRHGADRMKLEANMRGVVAGAQALGFPALRMKIEHVILDERF